MTFFGSPLSLSNITLCNFFHEPLPPFSFTKTLKKILVWRYIYIYLCIYIYIYIYIYYKINLQTAVVSLFESSLAQLRSIEDLVKTRVLILLLEQWALHFTFGFISIYLSIYLYIYIYIYIYIYPHTRVSSFPGLISVARVIYTYMYVCICLCIWLLKYKRSKTRESFQLCSHSLLHIDTQGLTSHVGKMLLSI